MGKAKAETINLFGVENVIAQTRIDTMKKAEGRGCGCPVCGQFVKVYRRTITSTMARQLIHAWRTYGHENWFHVRNVILGGSGTGDFPKLEYWGLIESQAHRPGNEGKRTSGLWRVTEKGEAFIMGLRVPKNAVLYNADLKELSGPEISIADALSQKFDYAVLMGWKT